MNKILRIFLAGIALPSLLNAADTNAAEISDLETTRSTFIEWSKVQSQVSKESAEWRDEKSLLEDMVSTSELELDAIGKRITELTDSTSEVTSQKAELSDKIAKSKSVVAMLEKKTAEQEAKARAILPLIPAQLAADIDPLLKRLPKDAESAKRIQLSQRIQTVVGLLAQIEKFQSNINLVSEIKEVGSGKTKEVKTLYFGLATAFYADANAENAGYGYPSKEGWQWTPASGDEAARIAAAIAIQSNDAPPAFVSLPVAIK